MGKEKRNDWKGKEWLEAEELMASGVSVMDHRLGAAPRGPGGRHCPSTGLAPCSCSRCEDSSPPWFLPSVL